MSSRSLRQLAFLLAAATLAACSRPARPNVGPTHADSVPHFYQQVDYGSASQFNPMTEILNEGFDMLRQENRNRRLSTLPYHAAARNVWGALIHADSAV